MNELSTHWLHIEKIAQPQERMPVVNVITKYLPERSLLAATTYSDLRQDAALFLVNVDTLEQRKIPMVQGANCGHRCLVTDGKSRIYLPSTSGDLYCFDLNTDTLRKCATLMKEKTFLSGAFVASSGKVYVGSYPEAYFHQYDPATDEVTCFETLPHNGMGSHCPSFEELADGRLLVLTTGCNSGISLFDPATGALRILYHGGIRGFFSGRVDEDRVLVGFRVFNWRTGAFERSLVPDFDESIMRLERVDDDYVFCGAQTGRMYRVGPGGTEVVRESFPNLNIVGNVHHLGGGEFVCMGDNGLFMRFKLGEDTMVTTQIDNISNKGLGLQFLKPVPGEDVVVGAHFINSQIYRIDLVEKRCESSLNKVVSNPGQVNCATMIGGRCYLGCYTGAVIAEYNWREPFVQGENPRVTACIGHDQNRPTHIVNDGTFVYASSVAKYGHLGGAITVLDPKTNAIEVYRDFVPDQNPHSLHYWPGTHVLVGGTTIDADCKTAAPKAENAVMFMWDTERRETVHTFSPWRVGIMRILDMAPNGVCLGMPGDVGCGRGEYLLWDLESGDYEVKPWPVPGYFIGGLFMNEREFYGACEHGLFVLDVTTQQYAMLTETTKETGSYSPRCFQKLNDREFLFDLQGVNVMKATIGGDEGRGR